MAGPVPARPARPVSRTIPILGAGTAKALGLTIPPAGLARADEVLQEMDRRAFLTRLAVGLMAAPLGAEAQPAGQAYRIGSLTTGSQELVAPYLTALEAGLRELGYVKGRNVAFEHRYADLKLDRLPALAAELVRLKVDVIVAPLNPAVRAAKQATGTIPIVMVLAADPVGEGLIASLPRPGGSITGLTFDVTPETYGKHLQLLKEIARRSRAWPSSSIPLLSSPRPPRTPTRERSTRPPSGSA